MHCSLSQCMVCVGEKQKESHTGGKWKWKMKYKWLGLQIKNGLGHFIKQAAHHPLMKPNTPVHKRSGPSTQRPETQKDLKLKPTKGSVRKTQARRDLRPKTWKSAGRPTAQDLKPKKTWSPPKAQWGRPRQKARKDLSAQMLRPVASEKRKVQASNNEVKSQLGQANWTWREVLEKNKKNPT